MKIEIKNRHDGSVIYEGEAETLCAALEEAVRKGTNLYNANLRGTNLGSADLGSADLGSADLRGANLRDANLYNANLRGANLRGTDLSSSDLGSADLRDAYLYGANLNGANLHSADLGSADFGEPGKTALSWSSHVLISEILWRAAGDCESRLMLAAYVSRRTDWCWARWQDWQHAEKVWALRELARWVRDNDDAPEIVRERVAEIKR